MLPRHKVNLADMVVKHYQTTPQDIPSPLSKTSYSYACTTGFLQNVIAEMTFCTERVQPRLAEARTKMDELMKRLEHTADEDTWQLIEQIEDLIRFASYDAENQIGAFDRAVARVSPPARNNLADTPTPEAQQQELLVA